MALLANVSVSWYTSLEQGRDVNPSHQVLEGIAGALELTAQETCHLFVLAGRAARSVPGSPGRASPTLRRVMDDLETTPAYAMTAHGDLAYRNSAADAAFLLSSPIPPPHERNVVWRLFVDPALRGLYEDWETTAQAVLALTRRLRREPRRPEVRGVGRRPEKGERGVPGVVAASRRHGRIGRS